MSIYEALMLICFGASWPFALRKTVMAKSSKGKSALFLSLVIVGYICGIMHKILYNLDWVVWLYALNGAMVAADLFFYFKYRKNG